MKEGCNIFVAILQVSVGEGQMDIYSRLAKDRILLLGTDVNDEMANNLVAQMLFLANEDPGKDITMYSECPTPRKTFLERLYLRKRRLHLKIPDDRLIF